ncbi:MAG: hypothetical protein DMG43_04920 [Acidobacteria bacterium]|nr:MAG: hypothetical protein DMG43_04920 [Acidobacteriota bacterium]
MPLPETIAIRFTEEDAGYVTVRPVVKQTFRLAELTDMVVSVTGKNVGTVVYNGYRYWWDGFATDEDEITGLLAPFPDDDPSRPFNTASVTAVSLEIGGGTQRSLIVITHKESSARRMFHKRSAWELLLKAAHDSAPRYEKYSHAERADVYRMHLTAETAASLLKEMRDASPRSLRKKLAALQPPGALLFFLPRAHPLSA